VTRDRLYLEAIEEVYSNSTKVFIDSESSGNLMYLPLDQLIEQRRAAGRAGDIERGGQDSRSSRPGAEATDDELSRERRTRQ
jgi:membrane protease subunit HflK